MKDKSVIWTDDVYGTPGHTNTGTEYFAGLAADVLTLPIDTVAGVYDNTLWEVWAREEPTSSLECIGKIVALDSFKKSLWGDSRLWFKHEQITAIANAASDKISPKVRQFLKEQLEAREGKPQVEKETTGP